MDESYKKLIDLMVDKVLQKHEVKGSVSLSETEKLELKEITEKLQGQVEEFIENHQKKLTEHDFSQQQSQDPGISPVLPEQQLNQTPPANKQIFTSDNDIATAKTFLNNRTQ